MSSGEFPSEWSDPRYVAAVVGVLATGATYFYAAISTSGPSTDEVSLVLLAVLLPTSVAYRIAKRFR